MTNPQDAISIPIAYIEAFVMMLGAFLIGYFGCYFYYKKLRRKDRISSLERENALKKRNRDLEEEIEQQERNLYKKDRMDQDFEQFQFKRRAYSTKILKENINKNLELNFDRIGQASKNAKDNLQEINGIGPYTEAKLNDLGIYTFEQISKLTEDDIATITDLIKFFPDRIKNDQWVAKARNLTYKNLQSKKDPGESLDIKKKENHEKTT